MPSRQRLGLIAGNGRFPLLVLDAARAQGFDVVVAAIKEETSPEIDRHGAAAVYWLSLGDLSKLIETFKREKVERAVMAGQVKHKQIFSTIRPDWRLAKLLLNPGDRNTDALIGAVAKVLADEGITLISSTELLEPLLAKPGSTDEAWPTGRRGRTSRTVATWHVIWRSPILVRRLWWPERPVSRWRRWKARTRRSSAQAILWRAWRTRVMRQPWRAIWWW